MPILASLSARLPPAGARPRRAGRPRILILTSSLLTDRMLLWSAWLPRLRTASEVTVWATSIGFGAPRADWARHDVAIEPFPTVGPFRELLNLLRRINEAAWDARLAPVSRLSLRRHARDARPPGLGAALRLTGRAITLLGMEATFETMLEGLLLRQRRSAEAEERLAALAPDLVVTTSPFWFHEPAVVLAARRRGAAVVALIPSWDNITTKNRLVLSYDGYLVWSPESRRQLHEAYPDSRGRPVHVVGVPQYDAFFDSGLRQTRRDFLGRLGLDPGRKVLLYALGSPNFLAGELEGARRLAGDVARGRLGDVQMIVRPHPVHDDGSLAEAFGGSGGSVVLQSTSGGGRAPAERHQGREQIADWVNTFRHADVVVNLASTVILDAALFDTPVVNIAYDPDPAQPDAALIDDITTTWTHLRPVLDSGGVWTVRSHDELLAAVATYLERPELHRAERRRMLTAVCGPADGRGGERTAAAILTALEELTAAC